MKIFGAVLILFFLTIVGEAQSIGQVGILRGVEAASTVPVGVDAKAVDAFFAALASNDKEGIDELLNAHRIYIVDSGTKVRVLHVHGLVAMTTEVRILEGMHKGKRGFVSSQWVSEK